MDFNLNEWLNLVVRWVHVFVGILWIGQTYFFSWLDRRFAAEEEAGLKGNPKQVWMVHSGGFYVVEKQKGPELLPRKLHWFRWEAALTWLSGMLMLVLVYYLGGALVDTDVADIRVSTGVGIGVGVLVVAWVLYDFLWQSPLGKSEKLSAVVSYVLLVAAAFGLTRVLSARAAYIHVGALLGTVMAANVWMRILPAQRRLIAAVKEGKTPDAVLAARAKLRSKHNTYMVVPVVFIMVSNHFPTATYGHPYNWVILAVLILAGWGAARLIRSA
ncbi:MAG: urate hydroxylase PuuD [Terriglobia bacterium]